MPSSDSILSTPPGPGASQEDSLQYYKKQYEILESELADFQSSSKELESELERDIEQSEKRERQLKEKATNVQYEVEEWKAKYKQAKSEASSAQNTLQKEITELRDTNRTLQLRLRDIEVANDDFERKQRTTESSLEDMESRYNQTIERSVMLDEEMKIGEQERESLRIEAQRMKDELSDLKIETDIVKEKLHKAEQSLARRSKTLSIDPPIMSASPRSELSPTTTENSFDTPPAKTTSSSAVSDTPTPPSPPISEKSAPIRKPFTTPNLQKTRTSINTGSIPTPTPRQPTYSVAKPKTHARGPSIVRTAPSASMRQSLTRGQLSRPQANLPQSSSIMHLRSLRSKMQNLEERVQSARSKLPGPVNTPPRASPRPTSALGTHVPTPTTAMPSSVTLRSKKRNTGSTISGPNTLPESIDAVTTPSHPRPRPSRQSLTSHFRAPPTPTRQTQDESTHTASMAPPSRPESRASRSSYIQSHSRPGSRASISSFTRLGGGVGSNYPPNASTDQVRPKSSLSSHGYDGANDEDGSILEEDGNGSMMADEGVTPTPRRTTFGKSRRESGKIGGRISDFGSAIPSPSKGRVSLGGVGVGVVGRRQSFGRPGSSHGHVDGGRRPVSRASMVLRDVSETF